MWQKDHFARVCRSSQSTNEGPHQKASAVFINEINTNVPDSLPRVSMLVGEHFAPAKQLNIIPDTGAEVTVIGEKFLEQLKIKRSMLNPSSKRLKHIAGGTVSVVGSCMLPFEVYGRRTVEEVFVVPSINSIFLSITGCRSLKLIPVNLPYVSNSDEVINVLSVEEEIPKRYHLPSHRQRPEEVPLEPIEENVGLLEKWFLDMFPVVFDTEAFPLRVMNGKEMSIHLTEDAAVNVYTVHSPLPVPVH